MCGVCGLYACGVHTVCVRAVCVRAVCVLFRCTCGMRCKCAQAVGAVCVRLSEGLARSGCVAPGVTLLCDAGCTSWGFDRLQAQRLQPYVLEAATLRMHRGCASRRCDGM